MRLLRALILLVAVCAIAKQVGPDARAAEAPVTVAFTAVGGHTFTVPAGVSSIHVVAVGAPGGKGPALGGGNGAVATADLDVTPGQTLGVNVGGPGAAASKGGAVGGFNGGGDAAEELAGGGGGASDVRSAVSSDLSTRLVVAAGGGGGGSGRGGGTGTAGGNAGQSAGSVSIRCSGGSAGGAFEGGKGGSGNETSLNGKPGTLGEGGDAADGGGGGGGLFGGGGGGGSFEPVAGNPPRIDACGGGGGSSGFGPGTSNTLVTISLVTTPSVTITYALPASTPPVVVPAPGPGGGPGGSGATETKADISLPAVQHGKAVLGTVRIPSARSTLNVKLFWKQANKKKPLVVGRLTEGPLKMGLHSFTVKLNGRGREELQKLGKLKLTLSVKLTPPQGAVATASKNVTLKS